MRIGKKTVNSKAYFYLEHSFRQDGKVEKKEKYIGKQIPKDIGRIEKVFEAEIKKELESKLEQIRKSFQTEWKHTPESARQKEKEEIAIAFTYNTNSIEGSTITLEETREIISDKIAPNKPLREIKETEAHAKLFLEMLDKKEKLDTDLILKWHKQIFCETKQDIAGEFRDYLVRVGSYRAPDWQDVENLMKGLARFINKNTGIMSPVELAARAHYRFEKIHPFGDGNGRIGRLLMNHILWHSSYPMLIIEYKKRKSYYQSLSRDEEGFLRYFIRKYLAVHKARSS